MKKLSHVLVMLWLALSSVLNAQKAPLKFGEVSPEAIAETHFAADSSMSAAVLCEYGVFDQRDFSFTATIRYKVYTKEGLNSLIMSIPVKFKSQVHGIVYNMVDGKVVESNLESEHIYNERVIGDYTRLRIAPPDAREGSVIDIRYKMDGLPAEWNFQRTIPVVHSELRIPQSESFSFNHRVRGYEPLSVVEPGRWVARDMPAFRPEPFISSPKNYMTTMFIELSVIHVHGVTSFGYHQVISSSWEAVKDSFYDHPKYGENLRTPAPYLKKVAKQLNKTYETDEEKVARALNWIQFNVKWDKTDRLFPSEKKTLREVYLKERTGNSADINFLFLKLLAMMDIECYPIILSTRKEGVVNPYFPSISRFNYSASYVKVGDSFRIIDAAEKYYSSVLLSEKCLNNHAYVIKKDAGEWVEIIPKKSRNLIDNLTLSFGENGILKGTIIRQYADYAAASYRKSREGFTTDDEYLEDFEKENSGIYVMDYLVENLDIYKGTIKEEFKVEIDGKTNTGNGMIHFSPILFSRLEENPFKLESRRYPVDFAHGRNEMYILDLEIPDGYEIQQLPEPLRLVNIDKSASFTYSVTRNGNGIQIMCRIGINKPVFLTTEYSELRSFFDIVVNKEAEPVVLIRTEP